MSDLYGNANTNNWLDKLIALLIVILVLLYAVDLWIPLFFIKVVKTAGYIALAGAILAKLIDSSLGKGK